MARASLCTRSLSANTAEIVALINYLREVVDERMHLEIFVRSISVEAIAL